jgi:hypothetical protein
MAPHPPQHPPPTHSHCPLSLAMSPSVAPTPVLATGPSSPVLGDESSLHGHFMAPAPTLSPPGLLAIAVTGSSPSGDRSPPPSVTTITPSPELCGPPRSSDAWSPPPSRSGHPRLEDRRIWDLHHQFRVAHGLLVPQPSSFTSEVGPPSLSPSIRVLPLSEQCGPAWPRPGHRWTAPPLRVLRRQLGSLCACHRAHSG